MPVSVRQERLQAYSQSKSTEQTCTAQEVVLEELSYVCKHKRGGSPSWTDFEYFEHSYLPGGLYSICERSEDFMSEWIFRYASSVKFEAAELGV